MPIRLLKDGLPVLMVLTRDGSAPLEASEDRTLGESLEEIQKSYRVERLLVGVGKETFDDVLKRLEAETSHGNVVTVFDPSNRRFWKVTGTKEKTVRSAA